MQRSRERWWGGGERERETAGVRGWRTGKVTKRVLSCDLNAVNFKGSPLVSILLGNAKPLAAVAKVTQKMTALSGEVCTADGLCCKLDMPSVLVFRYFCWNNNPNWLCQAVSLSNWIRSMWQFGCWLVITDTALRLWSVFLFKTYLRTRLFQSSVYQNTLLCSVQ